MMKNTERTEVLSVQVNGKTRYGVMEVRRHKSGLGFVVHYGSRSQAGNQRDWGTGKEERDNMRVMAEALLLQIAAA